MKKRTYLFALILVFCCCGCSRNAETETKETTEPTGFKMYVNADTSERYDDVSGFLASEFCASVEKQGFTVYLPSYDTEKYTLEQIRVTGNVYTFYLYEASTEKRLSYGITYDAPFKSETERQAYYQETEHDVITSVDKNGTAQEVYVHKMPFTVTDVYNLSYLPFDGYDVYINSDSPTPDEAIAYIHEFDLVPAE